MAKFYGNIYSRALGSVGDITFSEASTRKGKVQTARQRVVPLNPQTPNQMAARDNLKDSTLISSSIHSQGIASAFRKSISKLPGYQSLLSLYQNSKSAGATNIVVHSKPTDILRSLSPDWAITGAFNNGDSTYEINYAFGGNPVPSGYIATVGSITRVFPRANIGGFRFNSHDHPVSSGSPIEIDMQGFPTSTSGILFFMFFHPVNNYSPSLCSKINWGLIT